MKRNRLWRHIRIYWLDFLKLCFGSYPPKLKMMNKKQIKEFFETNATMLIVFACLLFFLIIALIIYFGRINKHDAGTLGDAFNGLVGPFIALLSAILVYRSFVAQTEANERQTQATEDQITTNKAVQAQWRYETYLSIFNDIKNSYNNLYIVSHPIAGIENHYVGEEAIQKYSDGVILTDEERNRFEKDLKAVLSITNYYFQKLTLSHIQEKDFMLYVVTEFYKIYMQEVLLKFIGKVYQDERNNELEDTLRLIGECNKLYGELFNLLQSELKKPIAP